MSYVNYHDMVQELEAANPLTSWQSYAPSVQDGAMLSLGNWRSIGNTKYLCLHPDCEHAFDDDLALGAHVTAHFNQTQLPAIAATAGQPRTWGQGVPSPLLTSDDTYKKKCFTDYECPVQDCAYVCRWYLYSTEHFRSHFRRGDKYMCQFEGCGRGSKRWGDLQRHETTHLPGAPKLDCPEIGCQYKGSMGFARRDKLTDHRRNRHGLAAAPRANGGKAQKSAVDASFAASAFTAGSSMAGSI
ncbi:MAG: hypothetical protein FRX48_04867 [Lasallia pustulata]|uniref:C2H2-type domain-containing protein n=1 Tax=Lasallia pustulata TaxID=136370 RepID=A0A5M8PRH2_9LECA|nr:MAG: hypothetical protein FRX48_04867 [Lasallia pustulata]